MSCGRISTNSRRNLLKQRYCIVLPQVWGVGACLIDIIEKDDALGFDDISNNTNDYNGKSFLNTDESITNELNSNKKK